MPVDIFHLVRVQVEQANGKTLAQVRVALQAAVKAQTTTGEFTAWAELEDRLVEAWRAKYGVAKITVVSAHPLTEQAQVMLTKFSRGADVKQIVDGRLLGGAVVRADDRRLDGSVLGALTRLKDSLLA